MKKGFWNPLPRTRPGKWSVISILVFLALSAVFYLLVALGQRGGPTFFSNPLLAIVGLLAAGWGIAAFFTGVVGIVWQGERKLMVFLCSLLGLLILLYVLAEILFPH